MHRVLSVIGLGYVGLPLASAFAKKFEVIGFDVKHKRIKELREGIDLTGEVAAADVRQKTLLFTADEKDLKKANFYIVAVPTPVDQAKRPNLGPLLAASEVVGRALKKGDIVVYESTVYPGATEEDCIPVLEKFSELKAGVDFKVGYSPERINPGDKIHTFTRIKKVVAGQDQESLDQIADVYGSVVEAGVFRAQSIKVAEAAKVIENTQRDLNVALMNELSLIFDIMGIDTHSVLEAAGTKWNFLKFTPGLVGGHCIGVDPYYLTYKAEKLGYHPEVILAGRRINDNMGKFIAEKTVKEIILSGQNILGNRVTVLGLTFKEDCPDVRNSKVVDIVSNLKSYGLEVDVHDPLANKEEAQAEYGIRLCDFSSLKPAAAVVVAVAHKAYKELHSPNFKTLLKPNGVLVDVKGAFDKVAFLKDGIKLWRL